MSTIKIVLVGAGGYGNSYVNYMKELYQNQENEYILQGVVDPYVEKAPGYEWITGNSIAVYDSLDEFYAENNAELAFIATPIPLHKEHCLCALRNGSHVLVEKPLTSTLQDAYELDAAVLKYNRVIAVGFQWSFTDTMMKFKKDILDGMYGKLLEVKGISIRNRSSVYFENPWKGKYKDQYGKWCLDSVILNANSHYFHNMLFTLGYSMNKALLPDMVIGEMYIAKPDIETCDFAVVNGTLPGNVPFIFVTSYAVSGEPVTEYIYKFEKAEIVYGKNTENEVIANFFDGRRKNYGNPNTVTERTRKIDMMLNAVRKGSFDIPCIHSTAIPHLKVCNGLFANTRAKKIPDKYLIDDETYGICANDEINRDLYNSYLSGKLPSELGLEWAGESVLFYPGTVESFNGYIGSY